ncbi:hypothetical protein TWF730_008160 [Orbilia blumenaviensis]|uniref:Uncharacterized protein n=1 Tax=Orbilia blumenaviensis TaxID=1796055 RepID=A0AAV9V855_9PEZI
MHFSTILATSAAVGGALAGVYQEEPVYYTSAEQVYTSIKTCTDKPAVPTSDSVYAPVSEPVYGAPTTEPVYAPEPTDYPTEVTYTSYDVVTVTSCGDYVTNCPAATYTSTAYSVSTCTGTEPSYYQPPANSTDYYVPPPTYETETPEYPTSVPVYEVPTTSDVYTHTYYTTVCPGKDYCYATTITSTYCPGKPTDVPHTKPTDVYTVPPPSYTPATETPEPTPVPTYTPPTPGCGEGEYCPPTPPKNETTTPTYTPPPSYTGAASANFVSFGVAAVAGLAALFIAA